MAGIAYLGRPPCSSSVVTFAVELEVGASVVKDDTEAVDFVDEAVIGVLEGVDSVDVEVDVVEDKDMVEEVVEVDVDSEVRFLVVVDAEVDKEDVDSVDVEV